MDVGKLLKLMVQKEISDIHFKADAAPALRIHGKLVSAANLAQLTAADIKAVAYQLMTAEQAKNFEADMEMDLAYYLEGVARFRVNVFRQRGTIGLTLRLVPLKVGNFEELNLPKDAFTKLAQEARGLILFAGITGAGKTTSMNSFIQHLNETRSYRMITIEDPIEYYHQDIKSSIVQREVGYDTKSFGNALKHILRQDPDVVIIGEMRDQETVAAAITAAETGRLVVSTIHTIDAVQTIDRIIDAYPAHQHNQVRQQLAHVLKGIVAQRLIPSIDGRARYPATEVLISYGLVRGQISIGKSHELYKVMEKGAYYGMHTFDQDILRLFNEKKIDEKSAIENATNAEDLALKIRGVSSGVEPTP